jgi:L-amino acid N-acyltransferase YncA
MHIRNATEDDCDAIGLITVSASHSAFIGAVPEELLDFAWTPEQSAANWRAGFTTFLDRGQSFQVAESNDRVIGFVWAKPWADTAGYDCCVQGLYVLPTCQRQGVGRRLLSHVAAELHKNNKQSLEIGCVKENPSCNFYRHLGGVEIGARPVKVDSYETSEILFGWPDLSILI